MHVAIRADGGPGIGYGHLARSGALAEELLARDHGATFATTTPAHVRDVCPDGAGIRKLPSRDDPDPFLDSLDAVAPDVVFVDAYPVDTAYQRAVRDRRPLAVLQDDARHAVCADLFVNGNLYATDLEYAFVGAEPRTCLGTDYVLLRREIAALAPEEPPWREVPERAIVTMGGSDAANLTPTVVRAFDGVDVRVDAIVGPGFDDEQERAVRDASTEVSADVQVARDPDDLADRIFQADFGVCTASTTTYEFLALGTPIVSCPVVDNQTMIAAALGERGVATVVELGADEVALKAAIETYVTDPSIRRDRRDAGRRLVDGLGTRRVADALCELADV